MKTTSVKFKHAKVMIVGDIMLDRYWYGITKRISPEAPVPVVKINSIEERPGGAANVAMNVASLGADTHLIGFVGIDDAAQILNKILVNAYVKCHFIPVSTHPTITKLRVISHNQQLIRLDFEKEFENTDLKLLIKHVNQELNNVGALILSDYAKGMLIDVQHIISLAHKAHIPILVDPKSTNFEKYRGATILTPNYSEFESVVGICKCEEEIVKRGMNLIANFKFSALLITRSEKGMILLQQGKMPLYMSTQAKEVYDVTGAGDTVIGVLATTLAAGYSLEEACYFANTAAGVVIGKLGTSTIKPTELENAIHKSCSKFGIINEEELKEAVSTARKRGEKIVMTNGVFDILHAGHISYLTKARKLGDRLVVAVNSDASTKRLKGNMRPINSLEQRMIVLEALEAVDWVVSFDEDTPQRLIGNILPDLLVKGGDYQFNQVIGATEVWANGGKMTILNFENDLSTTNIINKIQNINYK